MKAEQIELFLGASLTISLCPESRKRFPTAALIKFLSTQIAKIIIISL